MKKNLNILILTALCAYTSLSLSMDSEKPHPGSPDKTPIQNKNICKKFFESDSDDDSLDIDGFQPINPLDIQALNSLTVNSQDLNSSEKRNSISDETFNEWFRSTRNGSPTSSFNESSATQSSISDLSYEEPPQEVVDENLIQKISQEWAENYLAPSNIQEYKQVITAILKRKVSQNLRKLASFKTIDETTKNCLPDYLEKKLDNLTDRTITRYLEVALNERIPLMQKFATQLPTVKSTPRIKKDLPKLGIKAQKPTSPEIHRAYKALKNIR